MSKEFLRMQNKIILHVVLYGINRVQKLMDNLSCTKIF